MVPRSPEKTTDPASSSSRIQAAPGRCFTGPNTTWSGPTVNGSSNGTVRMCRSIASSSRSWHVWHATGYPDENGVVRNVALSSANVPRNVPRFSGAIFCAHSHAPRQWTRMPAFLPRFVQRQSRSAQAS